MNIKELLGAVVIVILLFVVVMSTDNTMHGVKKYDCSLAEISPDYPLAVREACRRIRSEKNK